MAATAGYAVLEDLRIRTSSEQVGVIITLHEGHCAGREILTEPLAIIANVGEHSDIDVTDLDTETTRFDDIVRFRKTMDNKRTGLNGVTRAKNGYKIIIRPIFRSHIIISAAGHESATIHMRAKTGEAIDMVGVFMADENPTNFAEINSSSHSSIF